VSIVGGPIDANTGGVVVGMWNRPAAHLPQVLAARAFDQPVYGIIEIVITWLHALVAEVNCLLSIITNMGDVADRVVGVGEILHLTAWPARRRRLRAICGEDDSVAHREQTHQPKGEEVVGIECAYAIAVVDAFALPLRVVVNIGDRMQACTVWIEPTRRLGILIEPGGPLLEQVGLGVDRLNDVDCGGRFVTVPCDPLDPPVEGSIARPAGVSFSLEWHIGSPVHGSLVVLR